MGNWLDGCGLLLLWSHVSDRLSRPHASKHVIREEMMPKEGLWFANQLTMFDNRSLTWDCSNKKAHLSNDPINSRWTKSSPALHFSCLRSRFTRIYTSPWGRTSTLGDHTPPSHSSPLRASCKDWISWSHCFCSSCNSSCLLSSQILATPCQCSSWARHSISCVCRSSTAGKQYRRTSETLPNSLVPFVIYPPSYF